MTIKKIERSGQKNQFMIGDYFEICQKSGTSMGIFILTISDRGPYHVVLVNVDSGNIWAHSVSITDFYSIEKSTIDQLTDPQDYNWFALPKVTITIG